MKDVINIYTILKHKGNHLMSKTIVTSCRDCKFSNFEQTTKQVGCVFDLLDKYKAAGIGVIEAYDENFEFNVINRICMYSRPHDNPISKQEVLEQIKVKYQIILHLGNGSLEEYNNCLDSIQQQWIKPQHITVIRPYGLDVQPFQYTKRLAKSNIAWRYQDTLESKLKLEDLTDLAIDIKIFPYYLVLKGSQILPPDFSKELNELVNEKFTIFSQLVNIDGTISLVPSIYHKQMGGNSFKTLLTKMTEDEQLKNKIYRIEDLIPCMLSY